MNYVSKIFVVASAALALVLVAGFTMMPRSANALPAYAQSTGKACGFCHQNPAGGGALKPAGDKFKANGHKL
jgi:hypothetical protein